MSCHCIVHRKFPFSFYHVSANVKRKEDCIVPVAAGFHIVALMLVSFILVFSSWQLGNMNCCLGT